MKEYTQKEIIEIEGDEIIKNHHAKYGRLMVNVFNRFVKDLKQRYEHVEVIGKGGKKTKYILGKKREQLAERRDNRKYNGGLNKTYDNEDFYKEGYKIYMATDMTNGKRYVGSTTMTLRERIRLHKLASKYKCHSGYNTPFATAIREHGFETLSGRSSNSGMIKKHYRMQKICGLLILVHIE